MEMYYLLTTSVFNVEQISDARSAQIDIKQTDLKRNKVYSICKLFDRMK